MSAGIPLINNALYQYAVAHSSDEHPLLAALREETLRLPAGNMMSSPEQVYFIQLLIKLANASRVIEIGTFTGYATLAMAMALPAQGMVITCDIDASAPQVGEPFWQKAGVTDKITLCIKPALAVLDDLIKSGQVVEFAYIDADKKNNRYYYEKLMQLLPSGGLLVIDNVLWKGRVVDANCQDMQTQHIRAFNAFVKQDPCAEQCMLLLGDGITLVRKL